MRDFYESLCEAAGGEAVRADEPMAAHTTFRTGGKAAFLRLCRMRQRCGV